MDVKQSLVFALMFFCFATSCLMLAIYYGIETRKGMNSALRIHQTMVNLFFVHLIFAVILVEIAVRINGGLWDTSPVFVTHMLLVTLSFAGFIRLRLFATGLMRRDIHAKLAYGTIAIFMLSLMTGFYLLLPKLTQ